jgi:DNA-binding NarL/FixJ family response regulator
MSKNVANNPSIIKAKEPSFSIVVIPLRTKLPPLLDKIVRIDYFDTVFPVSNRNIIEVNSMKNRSTKRSVRKSAERTEIWIVEDNVFFQECLIELINNENDLICTHSFNSCEATLQQMESGATPSIILLDIGLPGMSGLAGIQKFKQFAPDTQIIIITVHEESENIFQAICAGAAGYLLKNSPAEKIIEAIHDVQNGGSPINVQIARKVLTAFAALNSPSADYDLTSREREILLQMIDGLTKKEIGEKLSLSHHTIDTYIRRIYEKLHVNKRSKAVAKALIQRIV